MIWHFVEVWLLFVLVFGVGCGLGAVAYAGLAAGPFAGAQRAVANLVGDGIDEVKWRLGVGPDWRAGSRKPVEWSKTGPAEQNHPDDSAEASEPEERIIPDEATALSDEPAKEIDRQEGSVAEDEVSVDDDAAASNLVVDDEPEDDATISQEQYMVRPAWLSEPRSSVPDNLQRIRGIGKGNEKLLNSIGIFHFGQIAAWTPAEMRWVGAQLSFPERIEREKWIEQAMVLASGGDPSTVFSSEDDNDANSSDEKY